MTEEQFHKFVDNIADLLVTISPASGISACLCFHHVESGANRFLCNIDPIDVSPFLSRFAAYVNESVGGQN